MMECNKGVCPEKTKSAERLVKKQVKKLANVEQRKAAKAAARAAEKAANKQARMQAKELAAKSGTKVLGCSQWCGKFEQSWDLLCEWKKCNGCSMCKVKSRRLFHV